MTLRISRPFTFKKNHKITAKNILRYDPRYLFRNNENGVWYDPSDPSTMFQDSTGITPVTAFEQPVGLILDKSKGPVFGNELVTNGGFDIDSSWTKGLGWTISGGVASITSSASNSDLRQIFGAVTGKTYLVSFDYIANNSFFVWLGTSGGAFASLPAGTATISRYIVAKDGGDFLVRAGAGVSLTIDNVSVREVPGNHAYQTTNAARPVLSARYNLLTRTEQFDYAAWTRYSGSITNNSVLDPLGGTTACEFTSSGTNAAIASTNMISVSANTNYTFSVWLRVASGTNTTQIGITYSGLGSIQSTSVQVTTAWQRFSISGSVGAETSVRVSIGGNLSIGNGVIMYIWGADLRPTNEASTLPPYQRVGNPTAGSSTTAGVADYDTVGFPPYLRFDGVDDFLVSSSINFTNTDKLTAFVGVRKLTDPATGASVIAETSADPNINNGQISIVGLSRFATPATTYSISSKGTVMRGVATSSSAYNAPVTNVLTGQFDISSDICNFRIDSLNISTDNEDQGTGNFGNYPLYIGRRGGTILPFNGRIYSLIIRGAQTNTYDLLNTEKWVSGKTGLPYTVNIDRALSEILFDRSENTIEDVSNSTIVSKR